MAYFVQIRNKGLKMMMTRFLEDNSIISPKTVQNKVSGTYLLI